MAVPKEKCKIIRVIMWDEAILFLQLTGLREK
jgi:hypothetical protein